MRRFTNRGWILQQLTKNGRLPKRVESNYWPVNDSGFAARGQVQKTIGGAIRRFGAHRSGLDVAVLRVFPSGLLGMEWGRNGPILPALEETAILIRDWVRTGPQRIALVAGPAFSGLLAPEPPPGRPSSESTERPPQGSPV